MQGHALTIEPEGENMSHDQHLQSLHVPTFVIVLEGQN